MNRFLFLAPMLAAMLDISQAQAVSPNHNAHSVEVFLTTVGGSQWNPGVNLMEPRQNMDLQIYVLNRISLLETALSNQLPVDLNQAKQIALQSIQQLYEQATAVIQNAAAGLSKAMQYGIDRYPAIVFNSRAVVYGVNDLESALDLYRQWLSESKR